jgi:hypothetical protein
MSKVEELSKEKFREVFVERGRLNQLYVESVDSGFIVFDGGNVWFKPLSIIDETVKVEYKPITETPYPQYKLLLEAYGSTDFLKFQNNIPLVNINQLVHEVYNIYNDFLDLKKEYKELLTVATFLSYQQEKVKTAPYIYFVGEKGTGKSRALELAEWLMYRPLNATSITGPNVYHYLADGPKVILDDEVAYSINNDPDKRSIYLIGYRSSAKVPRITEDSKGKRKQKFYNAYSLKLFASREDIRQDQFLDRCIQIKMVRGSPRFGGFNGSDEITFHKTRTKLLIWRLQTLNELFYSERPLNRVDELFNPLLAIAKLINFGEQSIINIRDAELNERLSELKSSLEYKVALATTSLMVLDNTFTLLFNDIYGVVETLTNGVSTERGNIVTQDYGEITKTRLGRICRDILGGQKHVKWENGTTKVYYTFTRERFERNCKQYQICQEDVDEAVKLLR